MARPLRLWCTGSKVRAQLLKQWKGLPRPPYQDFFWGDVWASAPGAQALPSQESSTQRGRICLCARGSPSTVRMLCFHPAVHDRVARAGTGADSGQFAGGLCMVLIRRLPPAAGAPQQRGPLLMRGAQGLEANVSTAL